MVQRRSPKRDRQLVVIGTGEMLVDKAAAFAQIAQRFERHEATQEDIDALGAAGSSLGGARPKVSPARHCRISEPEIESMSSAFREDQAKDFVEKHQP
jgi:hypothetical protein